MKEESKQPEALLLAHELDIAHRGHSDEGPSAFSESAKELRRLHAECEKLRADQMSQQHSKQAALNKEAREELARKSVELNFLQQRDFEALERFQETSDDDESYDIGKEAVQRLAHFGCLGSHGFGRYSITAFGSYVLNSWSLARELPFKMQSERDAEHRAAIFAKANQGRAPEVVE